MAATIQDACGDGTQAFSRKTMGSPAAPGTESHADADFAGRRAVARRGSVKSNGGDEQRATGEEERQ